MQYERNDVDFSRGKFRVRGDTIEIIPVYEEHAIRIEMFGDEIEALYSLHPLTGDVLKKMDAVSHLPGDALRRQPRHHAARDRHDQGRARRALAELEKQGKLLEAQRLRMRTGFDIEMMEQIGFCNGIENYSRHIDGRAPGSRRHACSTTSPRTSSSSSTSRTPPFRRSARCTRATPRRKRTLVEHGFRLPSALDNRPLSWEEFLDRVGQKVYLSATPGRYELGIADGVVEQIIRPTGPGRPADRRQAVQGPDRRPARGDPHSAPNATSACSSRR